MRPRSEKGPKVTLFPFLSILVCLIGVLTMMICTAALTSSGPAPPPPESPFAEPIRQAQADRDSLAREIRLNEGILDQLLARLRKLTDQDQDLQARYVEEGRMQREKAELDQELQALLQRVREEQEKLGTLEAQQPTSESRGTAVVVPKELQGRHKYNPLFCECTDRGLLVLPSGKLIQTSAIADSPYISTLLNRMSTDGKWCLFLLVRKGGVKAFNAIYALTDDKQVPCGFHPIYTDEPLDVSGWGQPAWLK